MPKTFRESQPVRATAAERRAHPRLKRNVEVRGGPEPGAEASMVTTDLSLGGLHCVSTADFAEMTQLAVRLMLPRSDGEREALDVEAVVVRREPIRSAVAPLRFELALFFTRMSDDTKARLERFLAT